MSRTSFLAVGEVAGKLRVSRSQLQNLFIVLPHIYIEKRQTRLFPAAYIEELKTQLNGKSATRDLVRKFNATDTARQLYEQANAQLTAAVNERVQHEVNQVADIFSVASSTVHSWISAGSLPYEEESTAKRQATIESGKRRPGGRAKFLVRRSTLTSFFRWVAPIKK